MPIKLVVVGGVAGGASAAARGRRVDEFAEIILFERGEFVSFANCGLPYYIGGEIKERQDLLVTTPQMLRDRFAIDVRTNSEVIKIDRERKVVKVKERLTGREYEESYDKLILSPGAYPIKPPLEGIDLENIFTLRNIPDTDKIKEFVDKKKPTSAVIVGGGFIGVEMAENLMLRGLKVTLVEMLDQIMAPLDLEMASLLHRHMRDKGIDLRLKEAVKSFYKKGEKIVVKTSAGSEIETDFVVLSIGVKPEVDLAKKAGLEIGEFGGIKVDEYLRTSDPDIYAVGDAIEVINSITGKPTLLPLAGPANRQGRLAADNALGKRKVKFNGVIGTAIVKVFDMVAATTGCNEKVLQRYKIPYLVSYNHANSHASYYPGATNMSIKLIFAPEDGKVLGAQIVGIDGVDKRIDVLATAIKAGMTVFDLEELELAYAPPFSSAKDPVNMAGFIASNILRGDLETVNWDEIDCLDKEKYAFLDVRDRVELKLQGKIRDAIHIPVNELRKRLNELDKDKIYIVYCKSGRRSYIACRILTQRGYKAKNLSGGFRTLTAPKEELDTVKACLEKKEDKQGG